MWILIVMPLVVTTPGLAELKMFGPYNSEQQCLRSARSVTQAEIACKQDGPELWGYTSGFFSGYAGR
jgi:hypothetical protein